MTSSIPIATREALHYAHHKPCAFCGNVPESVYLKGVRCVRDKTCPVHMRIFNYRQWARRDGVPS